MYAETMSEVLYHCIPVFPEHQNPHLAPFSLGLQMIILFQNCMFLSHWISLATAVLHSLSLNHIIKLYFQLTT